MKNMERTGQNRGSSISDTSNDGYHKEAEKELICALIMTPENYEIVSMILNDDDWYFDESRLLWRIMTKLYDKKQTYDFSEIFSELDDSAMVADLKRTIVSVSSLREEMIRSYAELVKKHSKIRQVQKVAQALMFAIDTDDVDRDIDNAVTNLNAIVQSNKVSFNFQEEILKYHQSKYEPIGKNVIKSGYEKLDKMICLMRSDLWVIAARPSVGKTAFAECLMSKFLAKGMRVAFYALEMSQNQLLDRMYAAIGQIPLSALKVNDVANRFDDKMGRASNILSSVGDRAYINANFSVTTTDIKREMRSFKPDVVIVDYLQLLTPTKRFDSKTNEVAENSRALKGLAKELNCGMIVLSQLNRAVEARGANNRPTLADLRDSGAIEQDANVVTFLFKENADDKNSRIVVDTQKNRSGEQGTIVYNYHRDFQMFSETDSEYTPQNRKARDKYTESDVI